MRTRRRYNIDLGAHLAVCDSNYLRLLRLLRLAPELQGGEPRTLRIVFPGADGVIPAALVEVLAGDRHTSDVALAQRAVARGFADGRLETRLKVRLYHDTRCAEVIEFQGQRRFEAVYAYPNAKMRQPDEKAQLNRFLADFLNLCLAHGEIHKAPATAVG